MTYVVHDPATRDAVVIDPVLDYDPAASTVEEKSLRPVIEHLKEKNLKLHLILETHAHADHVSGSQALKRAVPSARIAIGAQITRVQRVFAEVFDLPKEFPVDGSQFDRLLNDNETVQAGSLTFKVLFTPGHTPACASYLFSDAVFTGDALFMPDSGTGRCDFPEGCSAQLYDSVVGRLYALPEATRVFPCHDYQPEGRPLAFESSIAEEKKKNIHLNSTLSREAFVKFRSARDKTLGAPRLLLPSVQLNIAAGHLPEARANGRRYLHIPIESKT